MAYTLSSKLVVPFEIFFVIREGIFHGPIVNKILPLLQIGVPNKQVTITGYQAFRRSQGCSIVDDFQCKQGVAAIGIHLPLYRDYGVKHQARAAAINATTHLAKSIRRASSPGAYFVQGISWALIDATFGLWDFFTHMEQVIESSYYADHVAPDFARVWADLRLLSQGC